MAQLPLHDLVVVELGSEIAGRHCGLVLARQGATVHICTPRPEPARDSTALQAMLDDGKSLLDPSRYAEVLRSADVVLLDEGTELPPSSALRARIVPLGSAPGRTDWVADEMVLQTMGGSTDFTTAPDGTPHFGFGHRVQFTAGLYLYSGIVGQLMLEREHRAAEVSVSLLETMVSLLPCHTTQFEYNGNTDTVGQTGARHVLRCVDGWVALYGGGPWANIAAFLGPHTPVDSARFVESGSRAQHMAELDVWLQKRVAAHTVAETIELATNHRLAIAELPTMDAVLADAEYERRGVWTSVTLPDGRRGRTTLGNALVNGVRR
ncbi:CoA transferase [Rhodococcus koreensis]